ncbi:hypothetical protein GGS21DRAFT_300481 [Xylaria nigripes]|nr:hypothetical protein GGS21DRAFT_300481 [Xylaria nigripes]
METLPSYHEATSKPDWLSFVAPFVSASSWTSCCLVNPRFYRHFAPLLWQDPLVTIRQLGLHPNDDIAWYKRFIQRYARLARLDVRCMVKSLDFRAFALSASGLYSTEASERAISENFRTLPELFPTLACLLINGHPELDPGSLAIVKGSNSLSLELLDLARCRQEISSQLLCPAYFRGLVYLDISYVPGSLKNTIYSSLNPTYLPALRVLKVQGREMDDATAQLLCQTFQLQLWSLDLSNNKLTDVTIDSLLKHCFSSFSFRNDSHFDVEGRLIRLSRYGRHEHGPFEFVEESKQSASFTHPERFFVDAPVYSTVDNQVDLRQWQTARSDGAGPLRRVDADAAKKMLLQKALYTNIHIPRGGLTHLFLNGNRFTSNGIGRLLRFSSGRLEHFECDQCLHVPSVPPLGENQRQLRIKGIFEFTHLFRPVYSSSLRSLRIHHSLVTQVPDIISDRLSPITAQKVSETILFRNIRRIYPQRFVPDMNPRITSLTLTNIPARSIGPIIEQITSFLDLASQQQNAIKATRLNTSGRHSMVLGGLRHIRLELEPDLSDDLSNLSISDDIGYDKLLDPSDIDFSGTDFISFTDPGQSTPEVSRAGRQPAENRAPSSIAGHYSHWTSGRLKAGPYSETNDQSIMYHDEMPSSLNGQGRSYVVWIGPGTIGPHAAVNEYMWNLQNPKLRTNVGPATPSHVAAGVPELTNIFYAAWDAMIFSQMASAAARIRDAGPLLDVAAVIKYYRARTRGTTDHWDGKLELVRTSLSSRYHASEYWR